jgi:formylglycine-generating enzyme required for sulfatase activity
VWTAAERRLAELQGVGPEPTALPELVATVQGLLDAMGYTCAEPACDLASSLLRFRCRPQSSGLRPPLWVGCKVGGPLAAPDVQTLRSQLSEAEQGYLVAETRVLASAREAAATTEGRVRVFTLNTFYRELLDFRAYVQGLVDAYEASDLARIYVDLGAVRYTYDGRGKVVGEDHAKPLDDYVDAWLKEQGEGRNHISILGDYGTGKTSFCRQYAAKQARRWLADPDRARLPLLITLREYTKTLEVKSLITNALVNAYGIQGATFAAFERFNADGRLLLIFDGFDEMAQRTGTRTAVENFWELARVVVPGSKVLLTSRTHYFRTHHEAEVLLHGRAWEPDANPRNRAAVSDPSSGAPDYIDLRDRPNFEVLHLEPFTEADIQAVLRKRFPEQWQAYWEQIQAIYNLPDLARRPVLLEMIMETLPQLQAGQTVNVAQLYQAYTAQWLERDVGQGRVLLTSAQRRTFAEALALTMFHSGEPSVHFSRLPRRVAAHFGLEDAAEIDHFAADVRTCNFLNRDAKGNYAFAHRSFMEYFVASRLHRLMLEDRATADGPVKITEEIRLFIHNLFALAPKTEPSPPHDPPTGFVWVPPGEFILGGPGGLDVQIARLDEGVFIGKYPVTNAEYARFVKATDCEPPEHWKGPRPPSEIADHPVVYVSWHDAVAYTEWARQRLPQQGTLRLPMEQEWEKGARGVDGRVYPWGDTWDAARCNTMEKGPGRTTPVEAYSPAGDSPYRAADMAGNVWEWTASEAGSRRVVRGGSFGNGQDNARCAYRDGSGPGYHWLNSGFRVVVSPSRP